jgi:hypothetical protein
MSTLAYYSQNFAFGLPRNRIRHQAPHTVFISGSLVKCNNQHAVRTVWNLNEPKTERCVTCVIIHAAKQFAVFSGSNFSICYVQRTVQTLRCCRHTNPIVKDKSADCNSYVSIANQPNPPWTMNNDMTLFVPLSFRPSVHTCLTVEFMHQLADNITCSIVHSLFRAGSGYSTCYEILCILWSQNMHCHLQKNRLLAVTWYKWIQSFKIYFNNILPTMHRFAKLPPCLRFSNQNPACISILSRLPHSNKPVNISCIKLIMDFVFYVVVERVPVVPLCAK